MSAPLTVADVLDAAADLLTPEGAWTQGAAARDVEGFALVSAIKPGAVCQCIMGAVERAAGSASLRVFSDALAVLRKVLPENIGVRFDADGDELPDEAAWNDAEDRTQAEVVSKLREAAALARAQVTA